MAQAQSLFTDKVNQVVIGIVDFLAKTDVTRTKQGKFFTT